MFSVIKVILLIIFSLILSQNPILCQKSYSNILANDYNPEIAPRIYGKPVEVNVSVIILSISLEPDIDMVFELFVSCN